MLRFSGLAGLPSYLQQSYSLNISDNC